MFFNSDKWDFFRYKCQERWESFRLGFGERFSRKRGGGYRYGRMAAFRYWINDHHHLPMILCGVSMFVLVLVIAVNMIPDRTQPLVRKDGKGWYYDLNTGELFAGEKGMIPPVAAPSGELPDGGDAGVAAHVITYVDDSTEGDLVVAYLERLSMVAKMEIEESVASGRSTGKPWHYGLSVKRPGDGEWYPANSSGGRKIIHGAYRKNSAGQSPRVCFPD